MVSWILFVKTSLVVQSLVQVSGLSGPCVGCGCLARCLVEHLSFRMDVNVAASYSRLVIEMEGIVFSLPLSVLVEKFDLLP